MKLIPQLILSITFVVSLTTGNAQEGNNESPKNDEEKRLFQNLRIANLQNATIVEKKEFNFSVSNRFGSIKEGLPTFFGLDNSNLKFELLYGAFEHVQLGIGRESLRQTYSGSLKVNLVNEKNGFPLTLTVFSATNLNAELDKDIYPKMKFWDRLSYASQLIMSKKLDERLNIVFIPTFVRQNLVLEPFQKHNQMVIALGGTYKVSDRLNINLDYSNNLSRASDSVYKNPLAFSVDINGEKNSFQILLSNANSSNEPSFITNAEGSWSSGDLYIGLSFSRKI